MNTAELESVIISYITRKGMVTTWEIESELRKLHVQCPDELVLFLNVLKTQGKIKGELSNQGLRWWV